MKTMDVFKARQQTGAITTAFRNREEALRARIAALEHALRAYMHAYHTDESVPLAIEREAVKLLEVTK